MIGMLMRDDHRRQRRRLDAESQQARFGFAQLETAIDEDPCAAVFDQRGVAFGAGAEHRETDHGRLTSMNHFGLMRPKSVRTFLLSAFFESSTTGPSEIGRASCRERVCQYV